MKKLLLFCFIVIMSSCATNTYNPRTGLYSGKVYKNNVNIGYAQTAFKNQ